MSATIIAQNHDVITYEVNGRKRYIIEAIELTNNRAIVNMSVERVGRRWEDVYNDLDNMGALPDPALEKTINSMTY